MFLITTVLESLQPFCMEGWCWLPTLGTTVEALIEQSPIGFQLQFLHILQTTIHWNDIH